MNVGKQREKALRALTEAPLDVLIIGGGIVGSGIARDAAIRGLKVGLVEQHDFAFGTSSRSSRLLHGGMRYLAQGRIGMVRDASVEKNILHHIAPHLAEPLPFIFPTYRGNKDWVLWQLKIGVKIYDLLCGGRNLGKSTWLNKAEVLEKVPGLAERGLNGAVRYYDGFTNDARLVLDTLRSAAKAGAIVLNYCRFTGAKRAHQSTDEGGRVTPCAPLLDWSEAGAHGVTRPTLRSMEKGSNQPNESNHEFWECRVTDELNAARSRRREEADRSAGGPNPPPHVGGYTIRARTIVNATGPWADGLPHSHVKLRLTKGIHLVVERARLPVPDTVVMTEGKRILFAIPWGERTILGTTDTDYTGSLDHVIAEANDIRYVLEVTNQFFPNAKLTAADVISTWAGLRPLIADADGKPSDISRSHEIRSPEPGWWDVAGGKLTTYRLMAEQTVDQIVKALRALEALERDVGQCCTADEALLSEQEVAGVSGILPPEFSRRAVEHYCANEWVVHLDDVMVRRTSWHYYFADAAQKAERVADWMAELLGWTNQTRAAELQRYRAEMNGRSAQNVGQLAPRRELTNR